MKILSTNAWAKSLQIANCSFNSKPPLPISILLRLRGGSLRIRFWLHGWPLLFATSLCGCQLDVLHPDGPVGNREDSLIAITFAAMLIVVLPVIFMTLFFAWRYRAGGNANYRPKWARSWTIEASVWGVPFVIVLFLSILNWRSTHLLDPYQALKSPGKSINIQVVALDWKWLFIYPDLHIASVNELEIPVKTQVNFLITSNGVMNVFFIPRLGTQIYAMAGMQTHLHLLAKNPGNFRGLSANFSGPGFSDMQFSTNAVDADHFDSWVKRVRSSPARLDEAGYAALAKPSLDNKVVHYGDVSPNLFNTIITAHSGSMQMTNQGSP
jgi:cytochrome o ubiquinol oxidase subunit II